MDILENITKGNWQVSTHDDTEEVVIRGENDIILANCEYEFLSAKKYEIGMDFNKFMIVKKEIEANAKLMSKAPLMAQYIDYVEGKIDINEIPLDFEQWQDFENSINKY